jgi:hypothetical protein
MHVRNTIRAHLHRRLQGVDVAADVNAAIDANVLRRRRRVAQTPSARTTTKEET